MILLELVMSKENVFYLTVHTIFDLEKLSNEEYLEEFRFIRDDICKLKKVFNIPD